MKHLSRALLSTALLLAAATPAAAQLPDDKHWFYEYGGPSSDSFALTPFGHHLYIGGLFLRTDNDTKKKNLTRFNLLSEGWERVPGIDETISGGVWAIHAGDDGWLYVGGNFTNIAGTVSSAVARFRPGDSTWSALTDTAPTLVSAGQGAGPTNGRVLALVKIGASLYVGGEYTGPGGSPQNEKYIRRYHLTTSKWERLGGGLDGNVRALAAAPNGDLIAGGQFTGGLARWNGTAWSVIGGGVGGGAGGSPIVRALAMGRTGPLYIGGDFDTVNAAGTAVAVRDVASWNGTAWSAMAGGFDAQYRQSNGTNFDSDGVFDMKLDAAGVVYAGGDFDASAGRSVLNLRHIARWDGTGAWKPMGSGVGTTGSQIVNCLAVSPAGGVYAGGVFNIGYGTLGAAAKNFARWLPSRDFTGYIPGAADNLMTIIPTAANARNVSLLSRTGTAYVLQSSDNMQAWSDIANTTFTGDGTVRGYNITSAAARRFYRFTATAY